MPKFTVIPQSTFQDLQMDAGVLLYRFNPVTAEAPADADIICATTGGITVSCVPTYSDMGEDVDNCPNNMKELKHLDSWNCTFGFTSLGNSPRLIRLALGAADVDSDDSTKIVPRNSLSQDDFSDLWWVGDKVDGGLVAVRLINALSTAGFSLTTSKNGKGQVACTLTGHVSINDQSTVPMVFYSIGGDGTASPGIEFNRHSVTLTAGGTEELVVNVSPNDAQITWSSGSSSVATVASGTITAVAAGNTIITASITVSGVTYNDTCTVIVVAGT